MTTLAPKLPYTHPFAGGYPRLGGQPLPTDPDAIDYLNRVAAADGAGVEVGVAMAVDAFVKGCKADSAGYAGDPTRTVWDALKASCIMCGARTLAGALVSLRQYGPELWDAQTPTITNGGGSVGSWDAETLTMANTGTGTLSTRPRFDFDFGSISGVSYRIVGKVSGDLGSLWRIFFGGTALTVAGDGTFSQTVTADIYPMSIYLYGNLGDASVAIEELSIKEVINDATNVANNFASGDYSRTTGLKGDGSTKYLDTNRANDADGQDDQHVAVYVTAADTAYTKALISSGGSLGSTEIYTNSADSLRILSQYGSLGTTVASAGICASTGLFALSRSDSSQVSAYAGISFGLRSQGSQAPNGSKIAVFSRSATSALEASASRLAFYSIGSSLDLAALDNRVTQLVTGIKFHSLTGLVATDYDPDTVAYIVAAYEAGGTL